MANKKILQNEAGKFYCLKKGLNLFLDDPKLNKREELLILGLNFIRSLVAMIIFSNAVKGLGYYIQRYYIESLHYAQDGV